MPPQQSIPIHRARGELPGKEVLPSGTPRKFLTFSFFLFVVMFLVYVGLSAGYRTYLNSQVENLEEAIDELRFAVSVEQQENLVKFFSQVNNTQALLDEHVLASKLFPVLERNTHTRVAYLGLDVSVPERKVTIEGISDSYDSLVSQLAIYEAAPEIEGIVLENSQRNGDIIRFRVVLTVAEEVFEFSGS